MMNFQLQKQLYIHKRPFVCQSVCKTLQLFHILYQLFILFQEVYRLTLKSIFLGWDWSKWEKLLYIWTVSLVCSSHLPIIIFLDSNNSLYCQARVQVQGLSQISKRPGHGACSYNCNVSTHHPP